MAARPALAVAACAAILASGDAPPWLAAIAVAAVVCVRSARSPWPSALVAAATAPISVPAAALLGCRVLVGEGVLWYLGRGHGRGLAVRAVGLARVATARLDAARRIAGAPFRELEDARAGFEAARAGEDEDELYEAAGLYALAAWAHRRWRELFALLRSVVRGFLRGQWSGPGVDREMLGLLVGEELLTVLARWGSLALAALVGFLVGGGVDAPLLGAGFGGRCAAALATLLIAMPLTRRQVGVFGAVLGAAVAWLLTGGQFWKVAAIAIAAGVAVHALRPQVEGFNLAGRSRWNRWPAPRGTPWRLRWQWRTASKAVAEGNERIGVDMFEQVARDGKATRQLFAAALGRAALLEVDLGRLQSAAAHLDEISAGDEELRGSAAVATGMLALALGELDRAIDLLRRALGGLGRFSPLAPRATLALCDALARRGEPDEALELIAELRARPFAMRGLAAMLETQATIVGALLRRGEEDAAASLLADLGNLQDDEADLPLPPGAEPRRRLQRANAQLLLLRGRLALEAHPSKGVADLERAAGMAATAGDEALTASAEALLGVALARSGRAALGLPAIAKGVEALEARRVQLRAARRRGALVVAAEDVYSWALRGLCSAQGAGREEAGTIGARLIESLRQSALAETLRAGRLPIDEETRDLIERIQHGEDDGDGEVERLRALLSDQVSARFAEAYLPRTVDAERLREAARGHRHHVLSFYVPPGGLPGWRAWIAPGGEMRVDEVERGGEGELLAELAVEGGLRPERLHEPLGDAAADWEHLAEQLLPDGLRERLERAGPQRPERVLVVPDGPLALVPWAALRVGGRPLVESAVLRTAPALELAGMADAPVAAERVVAHLVDGDGAELDPLCARDGLEVVSSREKFLGALRSRLFDGAYMASHGDELGLRQRIDFGDGSTLSAATALGFAWPSWAVFAACLVGRVEQAAGHEPLGLAISCMLRGADTVVASVVELTDDGALACGELSAALSAGSDPAAALREAQRARLKSRTLTTVADGLGLVCISTAAPQGA